MLGAGNCKEKPQGSPRFALRPPEWEPRWPPPGR
jgi:hypothetical protein